MSNHNQFQFSFLKSSFPIGLNWCRPSTLEIRAIFGNSFLPLGTIDHLVQSPRHQTQFLNGCSRLMIDQVTTLTAQSPNHHSLSKLSTYSQAGVFISDYNWHGHILSMPNCVTRIILLLQMSTEWPPLTYYKSHSCFCTGSSSPLLLSQSHTSVYGSCRHH